MTPRTIAPGLGCWDSISRHLGSSLLASALLWSCGGEAPGGSGTPGGTSSLEPCSVFSADEASRLLKGPVKQEVPSPIKYKGISTGGTCLYRSQKDWKKAITVRTEATPTGAQRQRFEAGLRKAPGGEVSGIGDRAYLDDRPGVTFLRGETLATVTVEGLSIEEAKQVAVMVAPRLPTSVIEPPPVPAASKGSGKVDQAVVGSWMLKQPSGRGLANVHIEGDGRFSMTLLAGNKQQQGNIDADNGVLHLYPDRGGQPQEIKYKVLDRNEMEWTDQKGGVTIARRQFR